jgi:hypothetical protein
MKMVVVQSRSVSYINDDVENPDEVKVTHGTEIVKALGVSPEGFELLQRRALEEGITLKVV